MAFKKCCSPSNFAFICLTIFTFLLVVLILDISQEECNGDELIAAKTLVKKYSHQVQELKRRNVQLQTNLQEIGDKMKLRNYSNSLFVPELPVIYLITPTHNRLEQKADLTRMSHTLKHVKNIYWIIIEDSENKTDLVTNFLKNTGLPYTHLSVATPSQYKMNSTDPNWLKPRGVLQRNAGIEWLRNTKISSNYKGVVYFADDDNTYSLRLFDEMRYTQKASVWPVGLVGNLRYEKPILKNKKVVGWFTYWKPTSRPFAMDMAGFAVNLQLLLDHPQASFSFEVERGYQETTLLYGLKLILDDLEPRANLCTEILVWHTRTEKSSLKNEYKLIKRFGIGSDLNIEV